jgi:uncharacterized protein YbdZ (MbtH family)
MPANFPTTNGTFYGVINGEGQYRLWPIFADVVQRGQQARVDA